FSDPGPVFHTIVSIKNDGHYFCRAGGNRPDGLNEPVTEKGYGSSLFASYWWDSFSSSWPLSLKGVRERLIR
ncbi:hypothetical protein, partial [Escherichia coli]|uniref:hypothetical protein n=1 Tax=Escherichia coli TaxID=562 RepID=UPI00287442BB